MKQIYQDRLWNAVLWILFGVILVLLFFYSYNEPFDHDEFEHIHTAWKISMGQEIYVDFFQHHHPFLDYLLVPVISLFGETTTSIFAGRYLMLLMIGGMLIVSYFLARWVFKNSEIALIGLILTSTLGGFIESSILIRPDVPQTLAGLLSIYFLFTYYDKKSLWSLIASSIFLAVSFLILQKSISLMIAFGILFLYDLYGRRIHVKEILIFVLAFLIIVSPYYIYLVLHGSFDKYYEMNWILNMHVRESSGYSKYEIIKGVLEEDTITCMLYVIGVIMLLRSKLNRQFAVLSLCLILILLLLYHRLWIQYFMLAMPLIGIVAAYALCTIFESNVYKIIVIIFAIYLPLGMMNDYSFLLHNGRFDNDEQRAQIEKINYVLSITDEGDKVYDGDIQFNLFRDDIDYFWFCVSKNECMYAYQKIAPYHYDAYESISALKPKVISTFNLSNLDDERIKNNYRPSGKYDDLMIRKE